MNRAPKSQRDAEPGPPAVDCDGLATGPSGRAVVAALAGMAAAWVAAGSTGLLSHPLRHAITWVLLGVIVAAAWPGGGRTWKQRLALVAAAVAAVAMSVPAMPVYSVLGVTLVLAVLAGAGKGHDRRILLMTSLAVAVLGVYRLACVSIPTVWSLADAGGWLAGRLVEIISGRQLWIGATFGGLDFLVLMAVLYGGWLASTPSPRLTRAVYAAAAILCGHLGYLVFLSCSTDLAAVLPDPPPLPESNNYIPPPWSWSDAVRSLLPWNVPGVGAAIQLAVAAMMFRWTSWLPVAQRKKKTTAATASWRQTSIEFGPMILAALIPVLTALSLGESDLAGKKIVAYRHGRLNWNVPVHDRYGQKSAGLYGTLPKLVASLGGEFGLSSDLSETDLAEADVLLLIHPDRPWTEEQLGRIWEFVRGGGSLLVAAQTRVQEEGSASSFNDVLEPTRMRVRFDTVIPEIDYWQHSLATTAHPATMGIGDTRNRFGLVGGSSIDARWPARPLLIGRWGWSDPGSDPVLTGVYQYDPGERLGDLVLAARQRFGSGTVAVLGDTSCLTNEACVTSYIYTGRLLAHLAQHVGDTQAGWRQALGLLACLALVVLILRWPDPARLVKVVVLLAASLAAVEAMSAFSWRVLPRGPADASFEIAYIDASHVEPPSGYDWSDDGIAGLSLTLMRNGYLPLLAPEVTAERLKRADLFISIAPARRFSQAERETVRRFVEEGGIFISMAGADRAVPSNAFLDEFGFHIPRSPVRAFDEIGQPKPVGRKQSRYLDAGQTGGYEAFVSFYSAWPIECSADNVVELVRDSGNRPMIAVGRVGSGKVAVIADTQFAMNVNLESKWGTPFYERYDAADFWRWFLGYLRDRPEWIPPDPDASKASSDTVDTSGDTPGDEVSP